MAKKSPEKPQIQAYEFSQLYHEKKSRIQEMWYSDFIEFLNWVENVNKWKKKEEWKRIVDMLFNKYSDLVIVSLFERFRSFKRNKPEWYDFRKILDEVKEPLRTEIYGDNVVKNFFGRYGNYLKYIKRMNDERKRAKELEEALKQEKKTADEREVIESMEKETLQEWAKNRYTWDDENIMNEDWDVIPNPKYEHVPVESHDEEAANDEREDYKKLENQNKKAEPKQLEIPFDFED